MNQSSAGGIRIHRVLVVDDNRDAADVMAELLRERGHEVATAYDGPGALEAAHRHLPELVLLDIGLPGLDGLEVARRLRAHPSLARAMLVAVTGYGQHEDRQRSREAGFDHHFVKPLRLHVLDGLFALLAGGDQR